MPSRFLRFAYVAEFLLALLTVVTLWSEIGGQGHLDLMPWYTKLFLSAGLALTVVLATAATVSHEDAWNKQTVLYCTLAMVLVAGMAAATYYYHLHENDDEEDKSDTPNPVALLRTSGQRHDGFWVCPLASGVARAGAPAQQA
jgi:hypothetical protein